MSAFTTSPGPWFTLTELQERMNLEDRDRLRESIRAKKIPMVQFGRELIIEEADFVAWIQANKSTETAGKQAPADLEAA